MNRHSRCRTDPEEYTDAVLAIMDRLFEYMLIKNDFRYSSLYVRLLTELPIPVEEQIKHLKRWLRLFESSVKNKSQILAANKHLIDLSFEAKKKGYFNNKFPAIELIFGTSNEDVQEVIQSVTKGGELNRTFKKIFEWNYQ